MSLSSEHSTLGQHKPKNKITEYSKIPKVKTHFLKIVPKLPIINPVIYFIIIIF